MTDTTEREPLEAGLPDETERVPRASMVQTMEAVPIPEDFDPEAPENFPGSADGDLPA